MAAERKAESEEDEYKMNITQLFSKDLKLSFLIEGVEDYYMNALRRFIVDEVPTMAIDEVEFRKNDSALYDEMIALRLGLVPLKTDLNMYNLPEECTCKGVGCAKCTLDLTLKTTASGYITADKIKSKDPGVVPVFGDLQITYLLGDQKLEFAAKAHLGRGKTHAKWSPGLAWFRHKPHITIDKAKAKGQIAIIQACPHHVLEEKSGSVAVKKDKLLDCDLNGACMDAGPKDAIEVTAIPDAFIFSLESWGQLSTKQIMEQSIIEFNKKLDELDDHLKV